MLIGKPIHQSLLERGSSQGWPADDLQRPVLEVAAELGIDAVQSSADWWGAVCPMHGDTQPSLRLNVTKNYWMCFGCGKGGCVASLYMAVRRCSKEAAILACTVKGADGLDDLTKAPKESQETGEGLLVGAILALGKAIADGGEVDLEAFCDALAASPPSVEECWACLCSAQAGPS